MRKPKKPNSESKGGVRNSDGLLPPPPKLSEDVEKLYASSNFEELAYRRIEKLRGLEKPTPEQREKIAEHDAIECRIKEAPRDVMREAHEAIDHGTSLLLRLIRSQKLEEQHFFHDGTLYSKNDVSFTCFDSRLDYINRQLVRLADENVPGARDSLFFQAQALTEAFMRLAQAHPEDFVGAAESALTMPSLRTRNPNYTADAEAIAKAIRLGDKHPAGMFTDDRERFGELCGYVVSQILDAIMTERRRFEQEKASLQRLQEFWESAEKYRGITVEEFCRSKYYPTKFDSMMVSAALPEFRDHAPEWWQKQVRPTLRKYFDRLAKDTSINAALWSELCKRTDNGTDAAKWKAFSDNCRNKLSQLARRME